MNKKKKSRGESMKESFVYNPFQSDAPIRAYGSLKNTEDGLQYEGLPYIGSPFPFKDDDPEEFRPKLSHNACCAQLDLSKEDDMRQYRAICQKICDGLAVVSFEEKVYDNDIKSWRVLIRWMEPYFSMPDAVKNMAKESKKSEKPPIIFPDTDTSTPKDIFDNTADDDKKVESRYTSVEEALNLLP